MPLQISSFTRPTSTRTFSSSLLSSFPKCLYDSLSILQEFRRHNSARMQIQITGPQHHINMGEQKDSENAMSTNAMSESPIPPPSSSLSYSSSPGRFQSQEHMIPRPKANFVRRMTITFATQSIFLGIRLLALNVFHGKYSLTLDIGGVPWWQPFSCYGVSNICAQVVLNRAGVEHIL
jgi:hypothetical protein